MTQTAFLLSLFLPASFSIWLPRKCCQGSGGGEEASQGSLKGPFQARGKKGRLCLSFERTHTHTRIWIHVRPSSLFAFASLILPPFFLFFFLGRWSLGRSVSLGSTLPGRTSCSSLRTARVRTSVPFFNLSLPPFFVPSFHFQPSVASPLFSPPRSVEAIRSRLSVGGRKSGSFVSRE